MASRTSERGRERLVVMTDRSSAPRIIPFGEDFLRVKLPSGTRVIYPPPPLRALPDVRAAIRYALAHPEGCDPLFALLKPGMKVLLAVDDISIPLPPMKRPDVRQDVLEVVLDLLRDYGVDDTTIHIATSLHRRMTAAEIRRAVGDRVYHAHWPDRLRNHDAEEPDGMVEIGQTEHGEKVILSRHAVEADLVIYVNVNLVPMDGGHKSVGVGLADYETLKAHHTPHAMLASRSFMDPTASELAHACDRIGRVVNQRVNVFTIETTVNNRMYGDALAFLAKDEDTFTQTDELAFKALQWTLGKLPRPAKRAFFMQYRAPYGVTGVTAGRTEPVHRITLEKCFQQYAVPVSGQCDVLVSGVPYLCPYNVNSIMNPLLVHCTAMGYFFNMYRGKPLLREGGVMVICHPIPDEFHPDHHPSYIEFFHRLLPETRDSERLHREYEGLFAKDPGYIHMYRKGHAYHGAHPFYMWYWGEAGRKHCGKIIVVGAESRRAADILGWETADTIDDAIAMSRAFLGRPPEVTLLHHPPLFVADVS